MKMREIRIEKVTLNIGCGDNPEKIEKAKKLLKILSGQEPKVTLSRKRSTFGVAKGKPLGAMVTLRKSKAEEFFRKVLETFGNTVRESQLDNEGNINFGIKEYIEIPGVKYSHEIGMLGLGVSVTLERPGYRVKRRKVKKSKIGKKHRIKKEEVIEWLRNKYGVEVV